MPKIVRVILIKEILSMLLIVYSVGIVRSRTQTMEFSFSFLLSVYVICSP
jgi:hypothetical protein